jgi:ABC-2 type transport system permease protein
VALALVFLAAGIYLAAEDLLPLTLGAGALAGAPIGAVFGSVSGIGFVWALVLGGALGVLGVALGFTQVPVLMRREFNAYFYSPIAYVVATVFLGLMGVFTYVWFAFQTDPEASLSWPMGMLTWLILPFLAPVLTMRLFAEELRTGTMEVLMTAPVKDWEVVVAKFLAALTAFAAMLVPTLVHVASLYLLSERGPDPAPLVGSYLGLLITAALFIALGVFASSLTRNQIIAAILGFVMSFGLFIMFWLREIDWVKNDETRRALVEFITYDTHFRKLSEGVLDTRGIVYIASLVVFILFLTVRIIESRKWR